MNWKWLLLSFSGRVNRKRYWIAALAVAVIVIVAVLLIILASEASRMVVELPGLSLIALVPIALLVVWVSLAVGVKRLHDRDKSAWWLLVFYLAPNVLEAIGDVTDHGIALVASLAAAAVSIWAFVELGCLRGTRGPNRYGADPLDVPPAGAVPTPH